VGRIGARSRCILRVAQGLPSANDRCGDLRNNWFSISQRNAATTYGSEGQKALFVLAECHKICDAVLQVPPFDANGRYDLLKVPFTPLSVVNFLPA
jgi:hypothetical protein